MTAPRDAIIAAAREIGFDAVGIATVGPSDSPPVTARRLDAFLALDRHGTMGWMADSADRRRDVAALWPEARSAIMLGVNYAPDDDPLDSLKNRDRGVISVHARGRDYHDSLKKKLKTLAGMIADRHDASVKVFVDTAPLMEKPLAARAGIGWQGKHTNLVSREHGSWLFLGAVLTTLDLPPDKPHEDRCGSCRKCLDICPTDAFPAPYQLDARRCISYLTIEHRGHIPHDLRSAMGNRIYGCDDCLAVCPWNRFAQAAHEAARESPARPESDALAELATLDDAGFRARFAGTSIKRTGRDRFLRNVMIAIGNSGDTSDDSPLRRQARAHLTDASAIVRAMAVWACFRLEESAAFADLKARHAAHERDAMVRREWEAA